MGDLCHGGSVIQNGEDVDDTIRAIGDPGDAIFGLGSTPEDVLFLVRVPAPCGLLLVGVGFVGLTSIRRGRPDVRRSKVRRTANGGEGGI